MCSLGSGDRQSAGNPQLRAGAHLCAIQQKYALARPRKRLELATNASYLKCRQRVLEFLYERHRFVEAA